MKRPGEAQRARRLDGFDEKGAALLYVLSLIAIVGILTGIVLRQLGFDRRLILREEARSQALRLAESGASYALARLGGELAHPDGLIIAGLDGTLDGDRLSYHLQLFPWGAGCRLVSVGEAVYPGWKAKRRLQADMGQRIGLSSWPALILMDHGADLVMAGHAQVTGAMMTWHGNVSAETDYRMPYHGPLPPRGSMLDSTSRLWRNLPFEFSYLRGWFNDADSALAGKWPPAWQRDSGGSAEPLPDSLAFTDTVLAGKWALARRAVVLGPGASCVDTRILAPRVYIQGGAALSGCLVTARERLVLAGDVKIEGGQFLAGDSLLIDVGVPALGMPVFAVRGRLGVKGRDTSYASYLGANRLRGEALLIAAALDKPRFSTATDLVLGPQVSIQGIVYTNGFADLRGEVAGAIIVSNLQLEMKGSIFGGRLLDAKLSAHPSRLAWLEMPLVAPRFPVAVLRKKVK